MVFGPKNIDRTATATPAMRSAARTTAATAVSLFRGIREILEVLEVTVILRSVRPRYSQGTAELRCMGTDSAPAVPVTGSPDRARCRRCGIPRGNRGTVARVAGY